MEEMARLAAISAAITAPTSKASQPISSPMFPPSPPSSCGSPPLNKSLQENLRYPIAQNPPLPQSNINNPAPRPILKFSIDSILSSKFGIEKRITPPAIFFPPSPEIIRTPPKTPELTWGNDSPVDLSHRKLPIIAPIPLNRNNLLPNISSNPFLSLRPKSPITSKPNIFNPFFNTKPAPKPITQNINTSTTTTKHPSRTKCPENPEELANPKIDKEEMVWPAWVYCTRYSDRPSSGPRSRRIKRPESQKREDKRPRTAFTNDQLARLKVEFETNKYLTEKRRQDLARELRLNESQIKIWFQNKRAKIKKVCGPKDGLAQHLIAQGLYNHTTVSVDEEDLFY